MHHRHKFPLFALLAGGALVLAAPASAAPSHHPSAHGQPTGGNRNTGWHGNWRVTVHPFREHFVARFGPADRARWVGGRWHHGWHHGRFGWWWWAGGAWYWYNAPVYPYPDYVSDVYYDDTNAGGAYWYWCNNPRGYYPYVQACNGPWQPVPAGASPGGADQAGPPSDQSGGYGPPQDDGDQGPPPAYDNGPNDQSGGPPPGYDDQDQGPPPGADDEDQDQGGPPPPDDQGGPPPGDQNGPPPGNYGSPQG